MPTVVGGVYVFGFEWEAWMRNVRTMVASKHVKTGRVLGTMTRKKTKWTEHRVDACSD